MKYKGGFYVKKNKKMSTIFIFVLLICIITLLLSLYLSNNIWTIIEAIATVLGVIMVLFELKESRDIAEGTFISELSDSFINNISIQHIYKKMELNQEITDKDTIDIVAYLTYFETIYILLKKKAIDISLIDDLFSYRFNLALYNETIRRISLIRHDCAYVNIYKLEKIWCDYKNKESILKKHNPNYDIILKGNKMDKNDIVIKIATKEQANEIHKVMETVYDCLEDKTLFVCDDLDYVNNHIENEGFAVIAQNKDSQIVGSFIFRYPKESEDNLGRDIGLNESELNKVVHMESVAVLPKYRGKGLQLAMLRFAEELIDKTKYKYFIATVSPDNKWSYNSFEKNGYKLITTKEKYDGLMRRIYLKEV